MLEVDLAELRMAIADGTATPVVVPLRPDEVDLIAWSGSSAHLENVASQLERVESGDVEYLTIRARDLPFAKGGIDFSKEPGRGNHLAGGHTSSAGRSWPSHDADA